MILKPRGLDRVARSRCRTSSSSRNPTISVAGSPPSWTRNMRGPSDQRHPHCWPNTRPGNMRTAGHTRSGVTTLLFSSSHVWPSRTPRARFISFPGRASSYRVAAPLISPARDSSWASTLLARSATWPATLSPRCNMKESPASGTGTNTAPSFINRSVSSRNGPLPAWQRACPTRTKSVRSSRRSRRIVKTRNS